ncbi:MAG: 2Fe-2S iron-sulfur cluster-binding protein, partial [Planctomycetota bacterium]|nr:2Fe-2S iron-sulfur cluster-binding protein [Planctomycetota bacterium]
AAASEGMEIPHYCYHPDIGVDGNCRMCLVEVNGNTDKLAISCQLPVDEGMEVETKSEAVKKAQKGVLEFLLINHPLDCTICDQAGECPLQDYTYRYGPGDSRFVEEKDKKDKKIHFSDKVMFDAERCILCTRCTRFFEEVRGSRPIGVENMGDQSTITLGPNGPIEDPYQMNIIDICPVGALTSKDFRFKQRVWFMDFAETVCPGCSKGCNMTAGAYQGKLLRFVPRRNPEVNRSWMCDDGRLSYDLYNLDERTRGAAISGEPANTAQVLEEISRLVGDGKGVGVLASTLNTCEELFALSHWAKKSGIEHRWHGERTWEADGFLKQTDATPNTAGAQALGFEAIPDQVEGLRGLVVAGDVDVPSSVLAGLDFLVLQAPQKGVLGDAAMILLPGRTPLEKKGTWINHEGHRQFIRPLLDPGVDVPEDWAIWNDLSGGEWADYPSLKAATDVSLDRGDGVKELSSEVTSSS